MPAESILGQVSYLCDNLHRSVGGSNRIKFVFFFKTTTFLELDLFADTGICHK